MTNDIVRTTDLRVGDAAYADFSRYGRITVKTGKVISISPTGVAKVEFGDTARSFLKSGSERGQTFSDAAQLISKDRYDRQLATMQQQARERVAQTAVKDASNIAATAANKAAMIEALTKALAAVEAI